VLKRQRPKCAHVKTNGDPCSRYVLTKEGLQKMQAEGADLVASPERFCAFHARTPEALHEMQSRGGAFSKQRHDERQAEKLQAALDARETMPREFVVRIQQLLRELLTAKLPGTYESDYRLVIVGAFLAAHLYSAPDDRERLLHELLPRDVRGRRSTHEDAQEELRALIDEIPEEERELAWELLTTAA